MTHINDHDAGLVVVDPIDDPPGADSHREQTPAASEGLDLSGCRIVSEITQGVAYPLADYRIKCLVLLAGTRGQLDLVGGHPRLILGKISVNVGEPVGAPVVGLPLRKCFFASGKVGGLFEGLKWRRPRRLQRSRARSRLSADPAGR